MSIVITTSCSTITPAIQETNTYGPAGHVEVLYQEPKKPYDVIALVSQEGATYFATVEDAIGKCRELSVKAGADALILTATSGPTLSHAANATGKAIKWRH